MATKPARYQRWVAAFDNHGCQQDAGAVKAFHAFCRWFKPTIRVHGGDCFDFAALRRGADDDEKRLSFADDVAAGVEFLQTLKPTHFLRGNHDERLWDALQSDDGKLLDLANYLVTDINAAIKDVPMLPYCKRRGVLKMGHLKFIHGYNSGITATRLAAMAYGSVVMGHIHSTHSHAIPGIEPRVGRSAGCLCRLDMPYNRGQLNTLAQSHGFAYGLLKPSGEYIYYQAEASSGTWVFPSEFREFSHDGKITSI